MFETSSLCGLMYVVKGTHPTIYLKVSILHKLETYGTCSIMPHTALKSKANPPYKKMNKRAPFIPTYMQFDSVICC